MPSRSRSSSTRRKRSAVTRIQKTLRGKQGRKRAKKFRSIQRNNAIKENECSICHEQLMQDVNVLPCSHRFHNECIESWITSHNSCPLCRAPISEPEEEDEEALEREREEAILRLQDVVTQRTELEQQVMALRAQLLQHSSILREAYNRQERDWIPYRVARQARVQAEQENSHNLNEFVQAQEAALQVYNASSNAYTILNTQRLDLELNIRILDQSIYALSREEYRLNVTIYGQGQGQGRRRKRNTRKKRGRN